MMKVAWSVRTFKKLPNVIFYNGSTATENMYKAVINQKPIKALRKLLSKQDWDERVAPVLRPIYAEIAGTVSGKKVHINKNLLYKKNPWYLDDGMGLRDIVNHEKFHTLPVIGPSESLAHIYGGVFSKKKDTVMGKIRGGVRGYRHLWETRPGRATVELSAAGGSVVGAKIIAGKTNKKDENDEMSNND